MKAKINCRG